MNQCLCPTCGGPLVFDGLSVDVNTMVIFKGARRVTFTLHQWRLFEHLWSHPGRICSYAFLFDLLYGHRADGGPDSLNIVKVFICHIRKKTKGLGFKIENVFGLGYRLVKDGRP